MTQSPNLSSLPDCSKQPFLPGRRMSDSSVPPPTTDSFVDEDTFSVVIAKSSSLGLGFSIRKSQQPGVMCIKKVFPLHPAWQVGLQEGDVLVARDNIALSGLSVRQAIDVLRASPGHTTITVRRRREGDRRREVDNTRTPQRPSTMRSCSYTSTSAGAFANALSQAGQLVDTNQNRIGVGRRTVDVFDVDLVKVNGGLGFTLTDCHAVRALVKEPALSDGRLRPGDRLVRANGVACDGMTHEQLIAFLRACPNSVTLTLCRARSLTPQSAPSSSTSDDEAGPGRSSSLLGRRPLRYEAKELVRSLQASRSSLDNLSQGSGSCAGAAYSSGTLRRRGLHQSPHRTPKNKFSSLLLSTSALSCEPTIESPLSPTQPSSLFMNASAEGPSHSLPPLFLTEGFDRLQIVEVTPTEEDEERVLEEGADANMESLDEYVAPEQIVPLTRPNNLSLFFTHDSEFIFNKP